MHKNDKTQLNRVSRLKNKKLSQERNLEYIRAYKEYHQCACGEGRAVCLDLHHSDPDTKLFALSDARNRTIKTIDQELSKCVVVCANCHRLIHAEQQQEQTRDAESKEELLF